MGVVQALCNPTISTSTNRISQSGYSFDADGNLTVDGNGNQFFYDAENHQKEVKDSGNNSLGQYSYDGEGRRVKKIAGDETTVFVYDAGGQLIAEYSTQTAQDPQVSYLTTDHLGSPRVVTDQKGAVTSRKDFSAFGEETVTQERTPALNYQPSEIRQDYTGYEKDEESGLEFAQARYYNATHGRFTSADPLTASATIRNPQTFNRYSYVLNSPYKFADPLGLLSVSTGACGQWCSNGEGSLVGGGGGALTAGGVEFPFAKEFEAMSLARSVAKALASLASNKFEKFGENATPDERSFIKSCLQDILKNGNAAAQNIASFLINSSIWIDVAPESEIGASAQTTVKSVSALNWGLSWGEINKSVALGYLMITIGREEFSNAVSALASVESNLVHEGAHALEYADVIHSVSTGSAATYDQSRMNDEINAKTIHTQFLIDRGGVFSAYGKSIEYITPSGDLNTALSNPLLKNIGARRFKDI